MHYYYYGIISVLYELCLTILSNEANTFYNPSSFNINYHTNYCQ